MAREFPLVYCVIDGEIRHVSEFSHLKPKLRPQSFCPECNSSLILKLGKRNIFHAAHKTSAICTLATPEGILHFNTKVHIFEQLKNGSQLFLTQKCNGWLRPKTSYQEGGQCRCCKFGISQRNYLWLENWDEVTIDDRFVGNRKPDIVLYKENMPIGAFEIFASHEVDDLKREDYQRLNLPWVEVVANEDIYLAEFDYDKTWKITKSLDYKVCEPAVPKWTCEHCEDEPDRYLNLVNKHLERELSEKLAKREIEEKRLSYFSRDNFLIKAKAVCFFYRNGGLPESYILCFFHKCSSDKYSTEILERYIRVDTNGEIIASDEKGSLKDQLCNWYRKKSLLSKKVRITTWKPFAEVESACKSWTIPLLWDVKDEIWVETSAKNQNSPIFEV
jgi:Competence protein CoiA-like family